MSGRTDWADGFIAVDWGTTNRRAYLVTCDGSHTDEFEDGKGILSVERGQFEGAIEQVRKRLGDKPMLLGGMIGSNRGWKETPYVPCPAGVDDLVQGLVWPSPESAIVPGVCCSDGRADVMRGEELQVLGAVSRGSVPNDCLVCHPGTHNKWIRVAGGRIESFRTVMTGELFDLLKEHSILAELLEREADVDGAFRDGALKSLSGPGISANLFEARARSLLGRLSSGDGASFVSGLLIGEDVRVGLGDNGVSQVIVMGRPELTRLYSAALALANVDSEEVDGEEAFIAGARVIAERLQ